RLAVQGGGAVHWTLRDFEGKPLRQFDSVPLESASWGSQLTWVEDYVWSDGKLIGAELPASHGGRRHFHLDHLGSPRVITNGTGGVISRHDYSPFGEEITATNQELATNGREEPMNFTGHDRDFDPSTTSDCDNY